MLQQARFTSCSISETGIVALARGLAASRSLLLINLELNDIDCTGAIALAEVIKMNKTITEMSLATNNIGKIGTQALADGLRINQTLKKLDLSENGIDDLGAIALAVALEKNKSLLKLSLGGNLIGNNSLAAFKKMLEANTNLQYLSLDFNPFNQEEQLKKALKENLTLCELSLEKSANIYINFSTKQEIQTFNKRNFDLLGKIENIAEIYKELEKSIFREINLILKITCITHAVTDYLSSSSKNMKNLTQMLHLICTQGTLSDEMQLIEILEQSFFATYKKALPQILQCLKRKVKTAAPLFFSSFFNKSPNNIKPDSQIYSKSTFNKKRRI